MEVNTQDNRLQIFFEEKPDAKVREELKGNGFRWSPKAGTWQRQLNDNAYFAANYVKAIAPLTGEKPTDLQWAHIKEQKQHAQAQPEEKEQTPKIPLPDDTISRKEMQDYGYSWDGMFPLWQEAAEKLFSQNIEVFRIYEDGTEGAVTDHSDLQEHAETEVSSAWKKTHGKPFMRVQRHETGTKGKRAGERSPLVLWERGHIRYLPVSQ